MGRKTKADGPGPVFALPPVPVPALLPPPVAPVVGGAVTVPPPQTHPAPPSFAHLPVGAVIGDGAAVVPPPLPLRRGMESLHPALVAANPQLGQLILANPVQPGAPPLTQALAAHNAKIAAAAAARASATMGGIPMSNSAMAMNAAVPLEGLSQPMDFAADYFIGGIDPDVQELCDHFHIEEKHTRRLSDLMKKRQDTFPEDLERLWEVLRKAHSPAGLLVVKMKEMDEKKFVGKTKPEKELQEVSKKHKLDDQAESKLADILSRFDPEKRKKLTEEIDRHLEVSNRPSAAAMTLLRFLGEGIPLKKPGPPAPGSYLDKKRKEEAGEGDSRRERGDRGDRRDRGDRDRDDRDRDRDYRGGRERRERNDSRDRGDRHRGRSRSRSRSRRR